MNPGTGFYKNRYKKEGGGILQISAPNGMHRDPGLRPTDIVFIQSMKLWFMTLILFCGSVNSVVTLLPPGEGTILVMTNRTLS